MRATILCLICIPLLSAAAAEAPFAEVVMIKGLASLEPEHSNLKVGMKLSEGDRVTVMSKSVLRLKLADGAAIQLGPHSELVLKRTREKTPLLRLVHGSVLSVVKPAATKKNESPKKERFEIRTGLVSLGVRGTDFFVSQDGDRATFVCVCSGKVNAKWGASEAMLAGKHHDNPVSILQTQKKPRPVKEASPAHEHSDKEIDELKKLL